MLQFFERLIPPKSKDPELARQETLLYMVILGLAVPGFLFGVANLVTVYLLGGPTQGAIAGFAVQFVYIAAFIMARRFGQIHLAAYLPVSVVLLVMLYGDYTLGMGHVTYIGYAMATVAAGILIGTSAGIVYALLSMIAHTAIGLLQQAGTIPVLVPAAPDSTILLDSAGLGFGLAVIVIVSAIYNTQIRNALTVEQQLGNELRSERQELQKKNIENKRILEQRIAQLRTLAEASMAAGAERNPQILMQSILGLLHVRLELFMASVYILEEPGPQLILRAATSEVGQQLMERGQKEALDSNSLIARAVQAKRIYSEGNLSPNPDRALPVGMASIRSELAVPMLLGDVCVGVLNLHSARANAFDDSDLMAMHGVAQSLAHGLELARLSTQIHANQEEIRALNRRYMAEAWGDLEQVDSDLSFTFDSAGAGIESVVPLASAGAGIAVPATVTRSSDGTQVTAPLILREQVIGALTLDTGTKELTEEDLTFIEAVTTQAALALENARLYTELTQRATYLQTANEIARDASTTLDLGLLLRRVTELIRERFGFSHAAVYLMDEAGNQATIQAATGEGGTGLLQRGAAIQPGSTSVVGHVLSSGHHYAANHVEQDAFFQPDPLLPDTRSELGIPLRVAGQVIGVIDIHSAKPNAFGTDEITILQTLSGQVAVAVQNARLFAQVSQRAERERKVVDITSRIRSTNDVSTILQTAVSELRRAFGAPNAAVMVGPMRDVKSGEKKPGT